MSTTVSCFNNSFWGPSDVGFGILLERMNEAQTTNDELKTFFKERVIIEEEYAKRLAKLSRGQLGKVEIGTLREALRTLQSETEKIAEAHADIALQLRAELDGPHTVFSETMRERRKIAQVSVEKTFKIKVQQQQELKRTKERCEAEFLRVNGLLAQQNLLMGKELERNNQKLLKAREAIQTIRPEYETAIKQLSGTTQRWNREWSSACDQFQMLEEERIDTSKNDESYERLRLSLERCTVTRDIQQLIEHRGTGSGKSVTPPNTSLCDATVEQDRKSHKVSPNSNYQGHAASSEKVVEGSEFATLQTRMVNTHPLDGITQLCRSDSTATFASASTGFVSQTTSSSIYSPIQNSKPTFEGNHRNSESKNRMHKGLQRKKSFMERAEEWTRRSPSPSKQHDTIQPLKAQKTGSSIFDALKPARSRSRASDRRNSMKDLTGRKIRDDPRTADVLNVGSNMLPISSVEDQLAACVLDDPIAAALQKLNLDASKATRAQNDTGAQRPRSRIGHAGPGSRSVPRRISSRSEPCSPVSNQEFNFIGKQHPNAYTSRYIDNQGLSAPPPAHSAAEMKQTMDLYAKQNTSVFSGHKAAQDRLRDSGSQVEPMIRHRSVSRAKTHQQQQKQDGQPPGDLRRSPSPSIHALDPTNDSFSSATRTYNSYSRPSSEISHRMTDRAISPNPFSLKQETSSNRDINDHQQQQTIGKDDISFDPISRRRGNFQDVGRSDKSTYADAQGASDQRYHRTSWHVNSDGTRVPDLVGRPRSKSHVGAVRDSTQRSKDGREILAVVVALYDYQATIPEEIDFRQGDKVSIIEMREDGWWLGELRDGQRSCRGLVPSNFFRYSG